MNIHQFFPVTFIENDDPVLIAIAQLKKSMRNRIKKTERRIIAKVEMVHKVTVSSKRSIQYDIKKKVNRLTDNLAVNQGLNDLRSLKSLDLEALVFAIPIKLLDDFISLDTLIKTDKAKLELVVSTEFYNYKSLFMYI